MTNRAMIGLIATIGIVALGLQFTITLARDAEYGALIALGDFFSFFTILSNIVVTIVASATFLRRGRFLTNASTQAAAALYIFVVMAIYHLILRNQWDPIGLVLINTTLLHYVVPILYLSWWVMFADKSTLNSKMPPKWLGFPVAFLLVSLLRGAITGWYPYSFLDVTELGYAIALRNAAMIAMVFLLTGYLLVFLGRLRLRGGHLA